jgi:phosphoribosylformylglycinamidine synthase
MAIAEIHITLKPGLFDAQGATVTRALHQLGYDGVRGVSIGKYMVVEADDSIPLAQLQAQLERMCRQLLANPVIENYEITVAAAPIAPGTGVGAPTSVAAVPTAGATEIVAPPSALSPSEQLAAGAISTSAAATPEPFAMTYTTYTALPVQERLAMQEVAWRKHGALILQALDERRAAWILIQGGNIVDSGPTLDDYPTEAHIDALGTRSDLVPWVFTRPT